MKRSDSFVFKFQISGNQDEGNKMTEEGNKKLTLRKLLFTVERVISS